MSYSFFLQGSYEKEVLFLQKERSGLCRPRAEVVHQMPDCVIAAVRPIHIDYSATVVEWQIVAVSIGAVEQFFHRVERLPLPQMVVFGDKDDVDLGKCRKIIVLLECVAVEHGEIVPHAPGACAFVRALDFDAVGLPALGQLSK